MEHIDHTLQLVLEQMVDLKRYRFGRSTEQHETDGQIFFMEVDGKIVFFNEAKAVTVEDTSEQLEAVFRKRPQKKKGKCEEDLEDVLTVVIEQFHGREGTGRSVWRGRMETVAG